MSDTPPPRRRMPRDQRRTQLLDIARRLFAERGYDGVSIDEIARAAGVSKPVVYGHFPDKDTLYETVVSLELAQMSSLVGSHLREDAPVLPFETALLPLMENVMLDVFDYIDAHPDGWKLLTHRSPDALAGGTYSTVATHFSETLTEFLLPLFASNGLDPETAQIYAEMFIGAVTFVGLWWVRTREFTREEIAAHTVNLLYRGLRDAQRDPRLTGKS